MASTRTSRIQAHAGLTDVIYLDYNATTPLSDEVATEMVPFLTHHWGNASSSHAYGKPAKAAIAKARQSVAALLGCDEACVYFTSGGTEANNWALRGVVQAWYTQQQEQQQQQQEQQQQQQDPQQPQEEANAATETTTGEEGNVVDDDVVVVADEEAPVEAQQTEPHPESTTVDATTQETQETTPSPAVEASTSLLPHVVTSVVEHASVNKVLQALEAQCLITVTRVPVTPQGQVEVSAVVAAFQENTILVSIMHANNEVGAIQPIKEIVAVAHERGILVHTDAAQSVGKVSTLVQQDLGGVDLVSVAAHKLYGPKGIGALYISPDANVANMMLGAGQQGGRRAGTEAPLLIVGFGAACAAALRNLQPSQDHMRTHRDALWTQLQAALGEDRIRRNGDPDHTLPNTLSVSIRGIVAGPFLAKLGNQVAASAGSACHAADSTAVSTVLQAMGCDVEWAIGTLRFSTGKYVTSRVITRAAAIIAAAVKVWDGEHAAKE